MRITTAHDLKNYIMDSVILPLRGEVGVDFPSPISVNDTVCHFVAGSEALRNYRYAYERISAEQSRRQLVYFVYGTSKYIVADFDGAKVRLWPDKLVRSDPKGAYVMNRLEEAFSTNTPFKEVISVPGSRNSYVDEVAETINDSPF